MQSIKIANDPRLTAKREQLTHLLKLMAGGAGVGMFGRSLLQFAKRPSLEVPFVSPGPSTLPIPVAVEEEHADDLLSLIEDLAKRDSMRQNGAQNAKK